MIRNTTLPPRVRAEAQLQLTQMHCYTRPTQIRNRCIMGGQGRGVLSDFKMSRVSRRAMRMRAKVPGLTIVVQFPNGGHGWKLAWCEASQLVESLGHKRCGGKMYDYVMIRTEFLKWSSISTYHRHDCIIQCEIYRNATLRQPASHGAYWRAASVLYA
jgi:ribosomal protein S14